MKCIQNMCAPMCPFVVYISVKIFFVHNCLQTHAVLCIRWSKRVGCLWVHILCVFTYLSEIELLICHSVLTVSVS